MLIPIDISSSTILLQFDGALIILIDKIFMDIISLFFQEVLGPYYLGQDIIHAENLVLSWNLSVQFLFSVLNIRPASYHGHETTIVAPHIIMHRKCLINAPLYINSFVYL